MVDRAARLPVSNPSKKIGLDSIRMMPKPSYPVAVPSGLSFLQKRSWSPAAVEREPARMISPSAVTSMALSSSRPVPPGTA